MITVARIDERLIHGQVAYSWTVAYKTQVIMVIDNELVNDSFQKQLLSMACPKDVKCLVVDEDKAVDLLNKHEAKKIFLVAKHPDTFLHLVQKGADLKSINVGGIYFKDGRRQITKTVYVDDHMVETFQKLSELGVNLETRTSPNDKENNLMKQI